MQGNDNTINSEQLKYAQDILNLLAGLSVNITDVPQLSKEHGNKGLIPVFLEVAEKLKDCIPDMIPFEVGICAVVKMEFRVKWFNLC